MDFFLMILTFHELINRNSVLAESPGSALTYNVDENGNVYGIEKMKEH